MEKTTEHTLLSAANHIREYDLQAYIVLRRLSSIARTRQICQYNDLGAYVKLGQYLGRIEERGKAKCR